MRDRPIGIIVTSIALAVIAVGAVALGLVLVATGRNVANAGLMGPFGVALLAIAFGFAAVFAAIAMWQQESWAWPLAMVVGIVAILSSIVGLIGSRSWILVIGAVLSGAVIAGLLPPSVREAFGIRVRRRLNRRRPLP